VRKQDGVVGAGYHPKAAYRPIDLGGAVAQRASDTRTIQTLDDLAAFLRGLRSSAGNMPFRRIQAGIRSIHREQSIPDGVPSLATVHGCFQNGRTRMNPATVLDIARVLGLGDAGIRTLEHACHRVLDRVNRSLIVATHAAIPAPAAAFTGRRAERERITALAAAALADGRPAVIVIEGMAGIGKTELAHRAALDLVDAGLLGDTHLLADLRGYDRAEPPAAADAVARGLLGHLDAPGRRIDALSPAARVALLHRELASRRALVVLDDAADEAQLEPLLPTGPGCVVLVTSRRRLTGLDAASRVPLDGITTREALDLLRHHDPAGRLDAAPDAAAALVELCRNLPLELAAVGRQLEGRPDWQIDDHVRRLQWLPPDEHSGPVLALSYRGLPAPAQRLFRLLAVHPGRRFRADDVGALASVAADEAAEALALLYDEHLLVRRAEGCYEFHDSVRALATGLAHREDPASRQHTAVGELLRHYRRRLEASGDTRTAWLSADRASLLASLHAADHDEDVAALTVPLNRTLRLLGHYDEARICNQQLLRIAHRAGNPAWEADAYAGIAEIDRLTGRFHAAREGFDQALRLRLSLGDRAGQAAALRGLAQTASNDDYPLARQRYEAALEIHRQLGNAVGEAEVRWGLAEIALSAGGSDTAAAHAAEVTAICHRIGNRIGEAYGLRLLGDVAAEQGDRDAAVRRYRQSLAKFRRIGNRRGAAYALRGLAGAALRGGDLDRSEKLHRRVLDSCRRIGDITGEADALRGLAETALARGDVDTAAAGFTRALPIYRETRDRAGEAHTLAGLGRASWLGQRRARARRYWQQALDLADSAGLPLAGTLRGMLDRTHRELEPGS
jgi:tetratricopeptide (TPR) repeat protein